MSKTDLAEFFKRFDDPELVSRIASRAERDPDEVTRILETFRNEALTLGWDIAGRGLRADARILEVGAGLCFLSLYLRHAGYDVTALEPAAGGYDLFAVAAEEIIRHASDVDLPFLRIGAEDLDPEVHGRFDFIFSVHVLEHVPRLDEAFEAMAGVLAPGGCMVHICPNYLVPYEPHFGIPLVPVRPRSTQRISHKKIDGRRELWESLNFVTAGDVVRLAKRHGLAVEFEPGVLAKFLDRLDEDEMFATRHSSGIVGRAHRMVRATRLDRVMERIPARLATPMIFTLRRAA